MSVSPSGGQKSLLRVVVKNPNYHHGSAVSAGYASCCAGLWPVHATSSASTTHSGSDRTGGHASRAAAGTRRKGRHPCWPRNSSILWSAGSLFIPILCWRRFSPRRPFWPEIPDAANWSNQHAGLTGDPLANAIQQDNLPWDPSVLALLPFPQVLQMMAQDPGWTQALGDAVLAQRPDVMDAVQRMRQQAYSYGYLRPNPYDNVVNTGGYVEILPVNPAFLYVPVYSPAVVFAPPRPGIVVGLSIHFAPSVFVGPAFVPFGWARPGFAWGTHAIIIGGAPWGRTWANRTAYVHPYASAYRPVPGPRVEDHHAPPAGIPSLRGTSPLRSG